MLLFACVLFAISAPATVLYDGSADKMPQESPWFWGLVGVGGVVTPPNGTMKTSLDTTADPNGQIGWLNVSPLALDPNFRPTVVFDLRVVREDHFSNDRAGLSVIVLGNDKKGVELSFWEDRVWAQNDSPLFTHGEEAFLDTTTAGTGVAGLRRYRLTLNSSTYRLSVDNVSILSGPRRDYTAFNGNPDPYEIANVLWVGDDTHSAQAHFEFSSFSVGVGPTLTGPGIRKTRRRVGTGGDACALAWYPSFPCALDL